jgi:hypothetical protein
MLQRAQDVVYEVVDGRAVLIDPAGVELITLNPVGTLVWQALDDGGDAATLTQRLLPEFEDVTAEQLERDIDAFLSELSGLGLVSDAGSR